MLTLNAVREFECICYVNGVWADMIFGITPENELIRTGG